MKSINLWGKKENLIPETFVTWWVECCGLGAMEETLGGGGVRRTELVWVRLNSLSVSRPTMQGALCWASSP